MRKSSESPVTGKGTIEFIATGMGQPGCASEKDIKKLRVNRANLRSCLHTEREVQVGLVTDHRVTVPLRH